MYQLFPRVVAGTRALGLVWLLVAKDGGVFRLRGSQFWVPVSLVH